MRKLLIGFLCSFPLLCQAQSLEQVIQLAQDSTIAAFRSRYEYEYHIQHFARFEALRKPQLELKLTPNYYKIVTDPTRDYVYIRNFNRFSTSAQLLLSQKVLGLGGDAYVGSQALWSEYFMNDQRDLPREFVTMPVVVGYQQSLLGYNPYRWEKAVEDARLEAARKQLNYQLHLIAEEATRRFFRLACAQGMLDMCERNKQTADTLYAIAKEKAGIARVTLAELRSLELQRLNAVNALHGARNEEQLARESLASYLRTEEQQMALTEARQEEEKARMERGAKVGVDLNIGMQQLNSNLFGTLKNPSLFMIGAVTLSIPLMDHGAARKSHAAATAKKEMQTQALREIERSLEEDVRITVDNLRSHQQLLLHTEEAVSLADDVFALTAENYANGLCDINTYSLAQNRRDDAYNQYLSALAGYWTTYYHLLTLTQYE